MKIFLNKKCMKHVKINSGDFMKTNPLSATLQVFLYFFLLVILTAVGYSFTLSWDKAYIIGYILILLFFIKRYHSLLKEEGKKVKEAFLSWKKAIPIQALFLFLSLLINALLIHFLGSISGNEQLLRGDFFSSPFLLSIVVAFLAPVAEEFIFRFPYVKVKKSLGIFLLYSFLFALIHLTPSTKVLSYLFIVPYFFLSLFIGYPFYKSGNIYLSIGTHILYNIANIMLLLI